MASGSDEEHSWRNKFMSRFKDLPVDLMLRKRDAGVQVLKRVPTIALDKEGAQSFLLDCSQVHYEDMFTDSFGFWNCKTKHTSTRWFDVDEDGNMAKGPAVFRVKKQYAVHPNTVPEESLVKACYIVFLSSTGHSFGYAMLSYDVRCPCEVTGRQHGNCKQGSATPNYQRTPPSILQSMRKRRRSQPPTALLAKMMYTPSRIMEQREAYELPRDLRQTYIMSHGRFPDLRPSLPHVRVKSEIELMLKRAFQQEDSFVRLAGPSHMTTTVDQLLVGYSAESGVDSEWCEASGSVTLVTDGTHKILVDYGNPWNGQQLLSVCCSELRRRSLQADDITDVVITHGHSDHCGNLSMFQSSRIYMDRDCARPCSRYTAFEDEFKLTERVCIIRTPGHTDNDLSVVVNSTLRGCVVIAGDIFEDGEADIWQPNSRYVEEQKRSRARIMAMADWIVPGHGTMFRNRTKRTEDGADVNCR